MRNLAYIALLLLPAAAGAQSVLENAVGDLKHGGLDVLWIWTSPARVGLDDLPALAGVLGAGAGLVLADEAIQEWVTGHEGTALVQVFDPFREDEPVEELGDVWLALRASAVGWIGGLVLGSETAREASVGCAASTVAQTVARRYVVYKAVSRTRPAATDDAFAFDVPGTTEWNHRSFFGGHAANAMTCIAFLNTRYDLGWAEPVLYGAAIGVGLARVVDQAHWMSDSFLGLAFGYAIGRNMALRSRARDRADPDSAAEAASFGARWFGGFTDVSVTSMADGAPALTWRLRF